MRSGRNDVDGIHVRNEAKGLLCSRTEGAFELFRLAVVPIA